MIDQSTLSGRIVAAAFRLAAERPWSSVTLRDIADAAGVTLADLAREFDGKTDILIAFNRAIDDEVLRNAPKPAEGQPRRDAVFEAVMARFDALMPHRTAIASIVRGAAQDPRLGKSLMTSQARMLQAAGIDTDGLRGAARVAGLASVYAAVFRIWLDDDDPGLARTMAALDRRLRSGERTLANVEDACRGLSRAARTVCDLGRNFASRRRGTDTSPPADSAPDTPPAAPAGSSF
jgi:ubiquinone biosynthesis protein COQ9